MEYEKMLITINLREFYPFYTHDVFIEVTVEVAEELKADIRYEKAYQRRTIYNKAHFSLNADDGIETSALACHTDNPESVFALIERQCELCRALNSLPESQGRRIEAHYLDGLSKSDIARKQGVSEKNVRQSIKRGLQNMKNNLNNFH